MKKPQWEKEISSNKQEYSISNNLTANLGRTVWLLSMHLFQKKVPNMLDLFHLSQNQLSKENPEQKSPLEFFKSNNSQEFHHRFWKQKRFILSSEKIDHKAIRSLAADTIVKNYTNCVLITLVITKYNAHASL